MELERERLEGERGPELDEDPLVVFLSFHTRIRAALTTLDGIANASLETPSGHKARALLAFLEGPLVWHELDEEGSLIPRLRGVQHPRRLERMLDACSETHRALGDLLEELLPALRAWVDGRVVDRAPLVAASRRMRALLEPHLRIEELEILPLARLLLSDRDLAEIVVETKGRAEQRAAPG